MRLGQRMQLNEIVEWDIPLLNALKQNSFQVENRMKDSPHSFTLQN